MSEFTCKPGNAREFKSVCGVHNKIIFATIVGNIPAIVEKFPMIYLHRSIWRNYGMKKSVNITERDKKLGVEHVTRKDLQRRTRKDLYSIRYARVKMYMRNCDRL